MTLHFASRAVFLAYWLLVNIDIQAQEMTIVQGKFLQCALLPVFVDVAVVIRAV